MGDIVEREWGELSALLEHGCGHMDSSACLHDIHAACLREGVDVRFNAAASLVAADAHRIDGVTIGAAGDHMVSSGVTVNCSGPWFDKLNAQAGVTASTTMLPTRIQVGHKNLPDDEDYLGLPFVADCYGASGIYFMPRRANRQLVFGSVDHRFESEVVDPDDFNNQLDPDVKIDYLSYLMHRLPGLPASGHISGFSHMYTVNQDDVHPLLGAAPEMDNYFLVNGFSGHGFKLAPAVGSLVQQQILGKSSRKGLGNTSIPLDFMSATRDPLVMKVKTHFA